MLKLFRLCVPHHMYILQLCYLLICFARISSDCMNLIWTRIWSLYLSCRLFFSMRQISPQSCCWFFGKVWRKNFDKQRKWNTENHVAVWLWQFVCSANNVQDTTVLLFSYFHCLIHNTVVSVFQIFTTTVIEVCHRPLIIQRLEEPFPSRLLEQKKWMERLVYSRWEEYIEWLMLFRTQLWHCGCQWYRTLLKINSTLRSRKLTSRYYFVALWTTKMPRLTNTLCCSSSDVFAYCSSC